MAWKLRKDRLQAQTPPEEENGAESAVTVSAPTEATALPEESAPEPSLEAEPSPTPAMPAFAEAAQVPPAAESVASPDAPIQSQAQPASFGLKWRSRKSRQDDGASNGVPPYFPADDAPPPPAETATTEPVFAPPDFTDTVFPFDPVTEDQADAVMELPSVAEAEALPVHPFILAEPEPAPTAIEEPHFAPLDFTQLVPPTDTVPPAAEPQETDAEVEEPLFSPMPTPTWNAYTPPAVDAHTEPVEEPFFPLPPVNTPFLSPQETFPADDAGEVGVEEPHLLSAEPAFASPIETPEDPLFAPVNDWNPFLVPEPEAGPSHLDAETETKTEAVAESEHSEESAEFAPSQSLETNPFLLPETETPDHHLFVPAPVQALEVSRPTFLPSVYATPADDAASAEPAAEVEPVFGTDASELSPFAPFQPEAIAAPRLAPVEEAAPAVDTDRQEDAPAPEIPYAAPPAFVSLTDLAPSPAAEVPPAFVTPFSPYDEMDAEREEIAPSLVMPETGTGVPRVAPFIVDVPTTELTPTATGTLVLRMGKLSANYPITKEATVIGRPDSGVQSYPDLEIELDDAVSRRHAEVRHHTNQYFVVDTMSTNGTFLNGEKLDPYKEYPLAHGDRIRIGDRTELVFE